MNTCFRVQLCHKGKRTKQSPKIVDYQKIVSQCGSIDEYETCTKMSKNGYKSSTKRVGDVMTGSIFRNNKCHLAGSRVALLKGPKKIATWQRPKTENHRVDDNHSGITPRIRDWCTPCWFNGNFRILNWRYCTI